MAGEVDCGVGINPDLQEVDVKDLPPFARELVALIGFSATIRLVEARPGIPLYVPDVMFPEHQLRPAECDYHGDGCAAGAP